MTSVELFRKEHSKDSFGELRQLRDSLYKDLVTIEKDNFRSGTQEEYKEKLILLVETCTMLEDAFSDEMRKYI